MKKPNLVACLVILLTFSAPALAGGAPGSTGAPGGSAYPGGGAPGAAASSSGATASPSAGSNDGGSGVAAQSGQGGPQGGHEGGPGGGGPLTPEKIAAIKADILKRMDDRIAEIQQRKQCIQAATTGEALHACMPNRPGRGGPEGGEHQGQQQ